MKRDCLPKSEDTEARFVKNIKAIEKCSDRIIPIGILVTSMMPEPSSFRAVKDSVKYLMAEQQYTIPAVGESDDPQVKYGPNLSEIGKELLFNIITRVTAKEFDSILTEYSIYHSHSGPYIPDETSPYFTNGFISLNTFENKNICGLEDGKPIKTGHIIMYTSQWAWSGKGKLYKLETLCDIEKFKEYFDQ